MQWSDVGDWLAKNVGGLVGLAGAVATGNIPAGVAAVASMVTEATGQRDPSKALQALMTDPETMVKLEEIARRNEADIRAHHREVLRMQLQDEQHQHEQQQLTIRTGDTSDDPYVRHTRPLVARQSWYATMAYCIGAELAQFVAKGFFGVELAGASWDVAMILVAPASAYIGFRTFDKRRGAGIAGLASPGPSGR